MPFNGLTPFLRYISKACKNIWKCVNALKRATSISTISIWDKKKKKWCQCPLTGLLHFYSTDTDKIYAIYDMCQCPSTGLLHFYSTDTDKIYAIYDMCQYPSTDLLHFYNDKTREIYVKFKSINALKRAYSISTLPLWKPLFIKL